ncbi:MAG: hypothetical protein L6M37_02440 [Candidatus Methylarchaceae archaeon HK02M1]|nr:hypothetical protein [Candidatus Methylarchaceae archaeon HK01M]MCP8311797.1 hypothetical protein [Candidatus Methylarchaceae archaeon HK02M1]
MSAILTLPKDDLLVREYFPNLAEEERDYFKYISDLIVEKVIHPILEAKDKEPAIEKEIIHYLLYSLNLYPIMPKIIERYDKYFDFLLREVKEKIRDGDIFHSVLHAFDVLKEHIGYFSELFTRDPYKLSIFRVDEIEAYFYTLTKTSLAFNVIFVSIYEKVEDLKILSQIAEKYAQEFEPFVAHLQVLAKEESSPNDFSNTT